MVEISMMNDQQLCLDDSEREKKKWKHTCKHRNQNHLQFTPECNPDSNTAFMKNT